MLNQKLLMAAMMASTMAEIFPAPRTYSNMARAKSDVPTWKPPKGATPEDVEAIVKAEAKRKRKAAAHRGFRS